MFHTSTVPSACAETNCAAPAAETGRNTSPATHSLETLYRLRRVGDLVTFQCRISPSFVADSARRPFADGATTHTSGMSYLSAPAGMWPLKTANGPLPPRSSRSDTITVPSYPAENTFCASRETDT